MADYQKLKAEYEALKDKQRRTEVQRELLLKTLLEHGCKDVDEAKQKIDTLIDEEAKLRQQLNMHMERIETALEAVE